MGNEALNSELLCMGWTLEASSFRTLMAYNHVI